MRIFDISLPLSNETPIYPGNVPVSINVHQKMPESSSHSSSIAFGSHTGTHVDAPMHALENANPLDKIPLENFVGACRVFDFSENSQGSVTKEMLEIKNVMQGERVLLKTRNSIRGLIEFYDDYVYLDGDAADYLARIGVILVGIDALSIKQKGSKDLRPHTSLLSKNIPIVEGLNLKDIQEGEYELVCLPLKFIGIDGSPARAILIQKD